MTVENPSYINCIRDTRCQIQHTALMTSNAAVISHWMESERSYRTENTV